MHKDLKGSSSTTYIFGIGGLAKQNLVDEAKRNMLKSNLLEDNQTLVNLTTNFKTSNFIGISKKVKCVVTADVVEFK